MLFHTTQLELILRPPSVGQFEQATVGHGKRLLRPICSDSLEHQKNANYHRLHQSRNQNLEQMESAGLSEEKYGASMKQQTSVSDPCTTLYRVFDVYKALEYYPSIAFGVYAYYQSPGQKDYSQFGYSIIFGGCRRYLPCPAIADDNESPIMTAIRERFSYRNGLGSVRE